MREGQENNVPSTSINKLLDGLESFTSPNGLGNRPMMIGNVLD